MSLKFPQKKGMPVLDSPSGFNGPKVFLTRRPLSVVGKPVLAEKHLPVQPSTSLLSRKCYCCDSEGLFRFRRKPAGNRKFRPAGVNAPESLLSFEARSTWADEFPRQSLPQRSRLQCSNNEAATIRNRAALFVEPVGPGSRNPAMHIADGRLKTSQFHADKAGTGFKFISDETLRLRQVAKIRREQINSNLDGFFSVLSSKKRSRRFACTAPVLKTFADYLTTPPVFFDGIDKRRPLPLKVSIPAAESADFSMQTQLNRSISQPLFATTLAFLPEKRLLEHEKHANFILENKAVFNPDFLRKKIRLTHNQGFARSCPEKQKKFSSPLNRPAPAILKQASDKPVGRIEKVASPAFSVFSPGAGLDKGRALPVVAGLFAAPRREPKFRLRLRLQRQNFPAASVSFAPILPATALDLIRITNRRISADFARMQITARHRPFSVHSAFARVCAPADYRLKKANFMVRAAKHARYTIARLRNIIIPRQPKSLTTTSLIFPTFAKKESRRLASPGKSYPELRLDKTGTRFTPENFSLNLLGQKPAITTIFTGTMPRQIRPATPQSFPDMRIEQSPKRRKPLRQLRFKLHSISEGFVSSKLKPLKKIEKETSLFPTCTFTGKSLPAGDNTRFVALKTFRQPRLKPRLRLRRFALQQILPGQIKAQLQLEMKICSDLSSFKMPIRHFIIPDLGAKSLRRFNCRISLLPHPFGFPVFSFSEPRFYSLITRPLFNQRQPRKSNLHDSGGFILKKDQPFLPPLSMKNPRRLLYNHLNPALASKEFYLVGNLALQGIICPAPRIADFLHTWLGTPGSCITPRSEEKFHRQLRLKQPQIKHLSETGEKQSYRVKSCDTSSPRMNRINRLLLRARRFSAAVTKAPIAAETLPAAKVFKPRLTALALSKPTGHEPQNRFSLFSCDISQLQQKPVFNDDVAEGFKSQFHARFRSFRFPWRPEIRMGPRTIEQPGQPDAGVSVTAIALPDELRSTAFISADTGANILHLPAGFLQTKVSTIRHLSYIQQSLAVERRFTLPETADSIMRMQNSEKYLQQFINPETFFIMREKNRSRLKKNLRNYSFRTSAKTIQLRPASEKYSEFGLKNRAVGRMPLEQLHWIIMMRSFLQPESPAMHYCVNLPETVKKYCGVMSTSGSLPGLSFAGNRHEKLPELEPGLRISLWSILTSEVKFSDLAFPVPAKSETKTFSAGHTGMPAIEREKTIVRPPNQGFAPLHQPSPFWQPVHNFTHSLIKSESENRFIEIAMLKAEAPPRHTQISIRQRREAFKPLFVPEWIDQVWQRPGLQKK